MNVLILTQYFSTTRGGGEYIFSVIAKKMVENNHNVWVITNKIIDEDYSNYKNIHLHFVSPTLKHEGGLPPSFSDNIRYVYNAITLGYKIIKDKKIDVIHSNNFSPALAGSILSSLTSIPHITTIYDVFSLEGKDYWKKWAKQNNVSKTNALLVPYFEKLIKYFKFKCVHTISNTTKEDLLKIKIKKPVIVIPPAIETSNNFGNKSIPNQFIYVGRLVFYKNLEIVIKAIDIVRKNDSNVKLIIIGDGPHKKTLENLVNELKLEKNVEFRGYIDGEEKSMLIETSNAMVFPSLFEGFGLVILEAFSKKRPILVSKRRPMSDIVTHGKNGYVLDPNDENDWANAINDLIMNQEKGDSFGKNGFELFKKNYSLEKMYEKILDMYNEIITK